MAEFTEPLEAPQRTRPIANASASDAVPSRRSRRMVLTVTWVIVAAFLIGHVLATRDYLRLTASQGLRGTPPTTPLTQTSFRIGWDGQTWIRLALEMADAGELRIKHTELDNAPAGREVHWNSGWALAIQGVGRLQRAFTGEPLPLAVEHGVLWLNSAVLFCLIVLFSTLVARRFGNVGAVVCAMAMLGTPMFYDGFLPTYVDHHGLLSGATLGVILGAVSMGAG